MRTAQHAVARDVLQALAVARVARVHRRFERMLEPLRDVGPLLSEEKARA